jgi:hypothetical protein
MEPRLSQFEILLLSLSVSLGLAAMLAISLWALKKFRRWTFTDLVHFIVKYK